MDGSCRIELQLFEHVLAAALSFARRDSSTKSFRRSPFRAICQHIPFGTRLLASTSARRLFSATTSLATSSITSNKSLAMVKPEPIDDNEYERQRLANIE